MKSASFHSRFCKSYEGFHTCTSDLGEYMPDSFATASYDRFTTPDKKRMVRITVTLFDRHTCTIKRTFCCVVEQEELDAQFAQQSNA